MQAWRHACVVAGTLLDPHEAQKGMIILISSKAAEREVRCTMDSLLASMHL